MESDVVALLRVCSIGARRYRIAANTNAVKRSRVSRAAAIEAPSQFKKATSPDRRITAHDAYETAL